MLATHSDTLEVAGKIRETNFEVVNGQSLFLVHLLHEQSNGGSGTQLREVLEREVDEKESVKLPAEALTYLQTANHGAEEALSSRLVHLHHKELRGNSVA